VKNVVPLISALALAGCSTLSVNQAIVPLQSATAQMIGLASSDELTISNVKESEPDRLGAQTLTYTATTTKGRVFECQANQMPGLLLAKPQLSNPTCRPIQVHK